MHSTRRVDRAGEGVPDHAVETSPGSVNGSLFGFPSPIPVSLQYGPDGYPLTADCLKVMFGAYYFSFACASAWQVHTGGARRARFESALRADRSRCMTTQRLGHI